MKEVREADWRLGERRKEQRRIEDGWNGVERRVTLHIRNGGHSIMSSAGEAPGMELDEKKRLKLERREKERQLKEKRKEERLKKEYGLV